MWGWERVVFFLPVVRSADGEDLASVGVEGVAARILPVLFRERKVVLLGGGDRSG